MEETLENCQQPDTCIRNDILKGIVAFVDVRSGHDIRSDAIAQQLEMLGATVSQTFTKKVTHVIFDEGMQSVYNKAKKHGVHFLSALWIENCKLQGQRVPENQYPAFVDESYENPLVKRKFFRPMQPLSFEEVLARRAALGKQNKRRRERRKLRKRLFDPNYSEEDASISSPLYLEQQFTPFPLLSAGLLIFDSSSDDDVNDHEGVVPPSLARRLLNKFPDSPVLLEAYEQRNRRKQFLSDKLKEPTTSLENPSNQSATSDLASTPSTDFDRNRQPCAPTVSVDQEFIKPSPTFSKHLDIGYDTNDCKSAKQNKGDMDVPQATITTTSKKRKVSAASLNSESEEIEEKMMVLKISSNDDVVCNGRLSMEEFKVPRRRKCKVKRIFSPDKCMMAPRRNNSVEFAEREQPTNSTSPSEKSTPTLVLTCFLLGDREALVPIIKNLGKFKIENTVGSETTHVICGECRRTLSVLYGTVRGCWLLSVNWIYKSSETGKWIDEEPYELSEQFPVAKINRLERLSSEPSSSKLFSNVGAVHIGSKTKMAARHLHELLVLTGSNVVNCRRKANILIGEVTEVYESTISVSELWVLDSITYNTVLPFDTYLL